jgi:hypothetical protein
MLRVEFALSILQVQSTLDNKIDATGTVLFK